MIIKLDERIILTGLTTHVSVAEIFFATGMLTRVLSAVAILLVSHRLDSPVRYHQQKASDANSGLGLCHGVLLFPRVEWIGGDA